VSKITESANQESCTVRSPWCNGDPATVVWAHAPSGSVFGKGTSIKGEDAIGCYACDACHSAIDGRSHINETTFEERRTMFLRGFGESFRLLIIKGLIVIP
jgi:hypothetical protein